MYSGVYVPSRSKNTSNAESLSTSQSKAVGDGSFPEQGVLTTREGDRCYRLLMETRKTNSTKFEQSRGHHVSLGNDCGSIDGLMSRSVQTLDYLVLEALE